MPVSPSPRRRGVIWPRAAIGMSASRPQRLLAWCWLLLRCTRLLVVLPIQLWRTWRIGRRLGRAYERTVAPIVVGRINASSRATEVNARLSGWALQGGYLVESYARLIGRPDVADNAAVAASFTRLYD